MHLFIIGLLRCALVTAALLVAVNHGLYGAILGASLITLLTPPPRGL